MANETTGHGSSLPHVSREIIGELLGRNAADPDFARGEWAEISVTNPDLRDLVSLVAATEEPHDLEARQRIIDSNLIILEAVGRALEMENIERLFQNYGLDETDRARVLTRLQALADSPAEQTEADGAPAENAVPRVRLFSKLGTAFGGVAQCIRPRRRLPNSA